MTDEMDPSQPSIIGQTPLRQRVWRQKMIDDRCFSKLFEIKKDAI